ncbi:MAG: hypothetical protein Q9223_000147 [Gallowayella weberi]
MDNRNIPPDGHRVPSEQAMQPISTSQPIISATKSSVAPSLENIRPSQQTQRLQLRNAGFRGQSLPTRRISPIWACSVRSPEPFSRIAYDENSPSTLEKRLAYGEDLPPNPVNILQELHNSARRKRLPPNNIGAIFQDDTATPPVDEDSGRSWYSETSNSNSPLQSRNSSLPMMRLREVSFNGRTPPPPLSSPLVKQTRTRNGNRVHQRTTSAEASKYIEHLESQLVAVNTKLDSLMSPTSHKARAAKLRALTSEARSLRQQVLEWEQNFDAKVQDERNQLAELEMTLTARLQTLEDEVEMKDNRVKDLEWQMENLRAQVKDAEGLEAVNADLERRIDFLTTLLVQSPTKLEVCSAASSPSKADPRKRISRPRSMMPKVPPSPSSKRLSLNIGPEVHFRRSRRSIGSACSPMQSPGTRPVPAFEKEQEDTADDMKGSQDSSDMGSGSSSSFQSPPTPSSRPTSLYSNGSFGAYSWGLPLPPETEAYAKSGHKQRRMRRFPSGTASLKPLILPNAAATPSLPTSAPIQATCQETPQRNFSDTSIDPTVAFLSTHELSSPINTPTQSRTNRSTTYAHREALSTLESHSSPSVDKDEVYSHQSPRSFSDELLETVEEEQSDSKPLKKERPRSLGEELADAGLLSAISIEDGLIPYSDQSMERGTEPEFIPDRTDVSHLCFSNKGEHLCAPTDCETTPRTAVLPVKLDNPTPKAFPSTSVAPRHAYGLFSRLKSVMLRTKQGPSEIARRLIHNAWAIGIGKLGGLGWWLLGLVYGSRWRKKKQAADIETIVEEVPDRNSNMSWHHFSPTSSWRSEFRPSEHHHLSGGDLLNRKDRNFSRQTFYSSPDNPLHKDPLFPRHEPHLIPCPDCTEPSSRRSLRLWMRFSLAIVLAVGLAIKDGPGSLLEGCHASNERLYEDLTTHAGESRMDS